MLYWLERGNGPSREAGQSRQPILRSGRRAASLGRADRV